MFLSALKYYVVGLQGQVVCQTAHHLSLQASDTQLYDNYTQYGFVETY